MATSKQVNYALILLRKKGYGTNYMSSEYKAFGCTQRERKGRVVDWLNSLQHDQISALITTLRKEDQTGDKG